MKQDAAPAAQSPQELRTAADSRNHTRRLCLKMWQLGSLGSSRVSAAVQLTCDQRRGFCHAFTVWKYAAECRRRSRFLLDGGMHGQQQAKYKRAGFQGFMVAAWKASQSAHDDHKVEVNAAAMDSRQSEMAVQLRKQLDLSLDNLSEANQALHKARRNEQNLRDRVRELSSCNSELDQEVTNALDQAAEASEALSKAKLDGHELQTQIQELILQKRQSEETDRSKVSIR